MRRSGVLASIIIALMALLGAPQALAATGFGNAYNELQDSYVYVDPQAEPTITESEAKQLNELINGLGQPLYLALVNNVLLSVTDAPDTPEALRNLLDKPGVYAVSSSDGFYAQAFGTSKEVADRVPGLAASVVENRNGASPFEVYKSFIEQAYADQSVAPVSSNDYTFLWVGLAIFAGVVVLGLAIWLVYLAYKEKRRKAEAVAYAELQKSRGQETIREAQRKATAVPRAQDTPLFGTPQPRRNDPHQRTDKVTKKNRLRYSGGTVDGVSYPAGYYPLAWAAFFGVSATPAPYRDDAVSRPSDSSSSSGGSDSSPSSYGGGYDSSSSGGGSWSSGDSGGGYSSSDSGGGSW